VLNIVRTCYPGYQVNTSIYLTGGLVGEVAAQVDVEGPGNVGVWYVFNFAAGGGNLSNPSVYGSFLVRTQPVSDITASAIPEPCTWAMMLLGFAGLGFAGYRRARAGQKGATGWPMNRRAAIEYVMHVEHAQLGSGGRERIWRTS
jgi:hypothetical protein